MNRVVLPIIGGLTTLATLGTISPVFSSASWLVGPAVAVAVVVLVGIGLRGSRIAGPYVTLLQLLLGLVAILAFFVPSSMLLYLIPTPAALGELIGLIGDGAATARGQRAPIAPNPGTSSLLALLAVPVSVIVDDFVASRRPALVGIPLLSVFAICAAIVRQPIPLWLAMLPLVGYALLLLLDQLTHNRFARDVRRTGPGIAVAAVVTVIAIAVGGTVAVAARLTDGGLLATGSGHERTTNEMVARTTDLAGQLSRDEPLDLFRVSTDDPNPFYLRAVVLDTWGEEGWSFATPRDSGVSIDALPDSAAPAAVALSTATIEVQNYGDLFVPTYFLPRNVNIDGSYAYDVSMQVLFGPEKGQLQEQSYQVQSAAPRPTEPELAAAPFGLAPGIVLSRDLAQPADVDPSVIELTQQVTAGASSPWEVAVALDAFFSDPNGGWTYSLQVPDPGDLDPLASFLQRRIGYCEQYSSAMASMFRLAGVPARIAVGYTNGEQQEDGSYQITTNDAHSWVEAYFDGVGWVPFDPTPIGTRAVPLPYVPSDQQNPGSEAEQSTAPPTTTAPELPPEEQAPPPDQQAQSESGSQSSGVLALARWMLIALAVLAVLLAPAAWRFARLRSRVSLAAAGGADGAHAAWDELRDYTRDLGVPDYTTHSVREQAADWRGRFGMSTPAIERLATDEERARYADGPQIEPLSEPLGQAREQIGQSVGPWRRVQAALLPRSLFRR
ncbi:hypothetical protein EK0264_01830 [Epidermidibacterium keratini]|uniref:Transglutaminase-like domain-containing protein n=1 Tax=Epidermidibacterium keratini TaxID=1891644 RepID=A0A7L4YJ18_9ACTN|nr:DUF3488 and transglutaminase-like domain-containing protein [Epidermidibacterium keratini]QHB99149.1 hypothetical protein EK0264_01830 [Epidermidibacterium keratini]